MRRRILERLVREPTPVGVLAEELPVSRSAVSQHLRVLKDVGLVVDRAEGTRRVYRVDPVAVAALRTYFDSFWNQALDSFRADAEAADE
jgi:DNA-binding transcriptional ArsR family regulator